ncbi:MAG: metal ABC transporter permease [Deltaproteobacteria bacterium]|nr:metal ABC transporter permease [Deltaproteobacteria bacterium]
MNSAPTFGELFANWGIFSDAVATGTLAGALLGFLGVQIVLRRMVFASSAIAQAAALGVALSFWVPTLIDPIGHAASHAADPSAHIVPLLFEPVIWALGASLLATLAFISNPVKLHLTRESILGVVFLVGAAGSVIIGDRITQESHDLAAILFGSAVVVARADLVLVASATVVVLGAHLVLWRPLVFVAFDPIGARVQQLPVRSLNLFVFLAVGTAVALCTRALGALPVFAFSVLPAMAALAVTRNLAVAFAVATVIGAVSGGAGYLVSFRAELPVGATQSALALGILSLALACQAISGFINRPAGGHNNPPGGAR